jgi:hypothetical protein
MRIFVSQGQSSIVWILNVPSDSCVKVVVSRMSFLGHDEDFQRLGLVECSFVIESMISKEFVRPQPPSLPLAPQLLM